MSTVAAKTAAAAIPVENVRNNRETEGESTRGADVEASDISFAADAPTSTPNAQTLATIRAIDDFYRRIDELYRQTAARMGLADCDFDILYALAGEDGLTQKQLCERGFSSKQTVHSAIKRMVAKGFVTMRGESPRTMRAYLTERGRAISEGNIRAVVGGECRAVESFSPDEQHVLVSALNRYADALDENLSALTFS